jgi:TonB-linked SusC/RagA family outer membrane protein
MKKIKIKGCPVSSGWHKPLLVMKLSTVLLFLFVMQVSASVYSQNTRFTYNLKEKKLIDVLKEIEKQSDFKFFFQNEQIDVERPVNLVVKDKTSDELLQILFSDKSVNYKILDNNIILLTPAAKTTETSGVQEKKVTGKVTDTSGQPVPGVSVVISGTTKGTMTDIDGFFSITNVPENASLSFSFVGMKPQMIKYTGQDVINVIMEENINYMDEVMVVAYGTAKKSSFTGSSTVLKADKIEKISGSGFAETLQGMSAGVNVVNSEGNPGGDTRIQIRGIGTIKGSTDPLYVVDGMPYDGRLNSISSEDIESMTVLKDASASSLYGSRAANGVVVITTKKGKSGKPQINFRMSCGTSDLAVKNPTKANPYQQLTNTWEGIYNDNYYKYGHTDADARSIASDRLLGILLMSVTNSAGETSYVSPFKDIPGYYVLEDGSVNPDLKLIWDKKDYDWYGAVYSYKMRQDYSLDVSGMTKDSKTSYYFSGSYLDDNGYGLSQYFKRYSFRVNVTSQVADWLQVGGSLAYSNSRQNTSGFIRALVFCNTLESPYLRNVDNTGWERSLKTGHRMLNYGSYTNDFFGIQPLDQRGDYWDNPDDASFSNNLSNMISAKYFAEAKLPFNFKFRTNLSVDNNDTKYFDYSSAVHGSDQLAPYGVTVKTSGGSATRQGNMTTSITWNNLLTFDKKIGLHSINFLAGQELYSYRNYYNSCYGEGIMQLDQYEVTSTTKNWSVASSKDNYALMSFLSKFEYGYNDKYYLSASYRLDGSSRFAKDNRWGGFGSAGATWRISKEDFMKDITWLDNLSLRGSYGTTGNDKLYNNQGAEILYGYQATYTADNMYGNAGLKPSQIATPNLKWEKNIQFNIGTDFTIFKVINGTIEYYKRKSKDLLYYKDLPLSAQAGSATGVNTNLGDIQNSGFEVSLNADVIKTSDFTWNVDANWSSLKNKVTYLPSGAFTWSERIATYKMQEGHSRFEFYMPKNAGIDPQTGSALFWRKNTNGEWEKTNDFTKVTADDYTWRGSALPKGYGAITNSFKYKNFDLSAMLYYSYGSVLLDYIYLERVTLRHGVGVIQDLVKDRWRKPGDNASLPRWSDDDYSSTRKATDFWLFKNNYARLRNLNIGYSLPNNVISKLGISKARVYLSGDNLLTFGSAKRRYSDPETGTSGNNYNGNSDTDNGFPGSRRVYMGGIQVSF